MTSYALATSYSFPTQSECVMCLENHLPIGFLKTINLLWEGDNAVIPSSPSPNLQVRISARAVTETDCNQRISSCRPNSCCSHSTCSIRCPKQTKCHVICLQNKCTQAHWHNCQISKGQAHDLFQQNERKGTSAPRDNICYTSTCTPPPANNHMIGVSNV